MPRSTPRRKPRTLPHTDSSAPSCKSGETFALFDADCLKTNEDIAAYLEAALEEAGNDPAFVAKVLGDIARSGNLSELARKVGMSREGLYKALSGPYRPLVLRRAVFPL